MIIFNICEVYSRLNTKHLSTREVATFKEISMKFHKLAFLRRYISKQKLKRIAYRSRAIIKHRTIIL